MLSVFYFITLLSALLGGVLCLPDSRRGAAYETREISVQPRRAAHGARMHRRTKGGRFLRYDLTETAVNGTRLRRRQEPDAGEEDRPKSKWNWAHLEDFRGYCYFMTIEIGDPPQSIKLLADTGSYETWVNPNCANALSPVPCIFNGKYDPSNSKLSAAGNTPFELVYGSGWATGVYWYDRFYFRNENVGIRQQFGIANDSGDAISGILGLGYGRGYSIGYDNIIDSLVKYDLINAPIYSVALGRLGSGSSEIVFGGINIARYSGQLHPVPVWPSVYEQPLNWVHFWVNLTSVGVTTPEGDKTTYFDSTDPAGQVEDVNVLVDTGVTYTYLPPSIVEGLAEQLGAWEEVGELKVDCKLREYNATVDFGFDKNGVVINVPFFDFIVKLQDGTCVLGAQKRPDTLIVGATFIRGAYLVYDQLTHNVWMSNHRDCGYEAEVREFGIRPGDVAAFQGMC